MSSSDESIRFVRESNPGDDPFEATSRRAGSQSVGPSSGRRRSLRRVAAAFRHLIDEEEEKTEGEEEKVRQYFFIPDSQIIYTPGPQARAPFPPANCLAFFLAQIHACLWFSIPPFYQEVARLFKVPLNQLVPNSFRIMASFYMIFHFNGHPVSAQIFSQCFCLKTASREFFLLTPRLAVSFLPAPSAPKKWKSGIFFALSSWPWGFPDRWIEETSPPMSVGERDISLTSFINVLKEKPYDCRALIDERLLGHFGLSPHVEPLADIMFNKYFRELSDKERERGGSMPPSHSARGTYTSSASKGKRPMSPSGGAPSKGPEKIPGTARQGLLPYSPPGLPCLIPLLPLAEKRRGYLLDLLVLYESCSAVLPLLRRRGVPPAESEETSAQKAEEKIKRMERENAQLREAKKEAANHRAQMEKELRRLSKVSADHEEALRRAVEKAVADYPNSEEGKNFLKTYWASKIDEYNLSKKKR
ncbi:UNVERIFIED_CONTAM: hypothetical protein Sradi_5250100 [Sesamum radiatum]|uniref:Uncharacterized protein n=1 Tax=Sesamum radiatum TaxID=300843 RepID=A0AAW2LQA5_SESRA